MSGILNIVPRGTFDKNKFDVESVFCNPIADLNLDSDGYYGLISSVADSGPLDSGICTSYNNAVRVLKGNTDYPVAMLDAEKMGSTVKSNYKREIVESSEIYIKYRGYIDREQKMADKIMRLEKLTIPAGFDFDRVESLSIECRQKLKRYSPKTIAQASRISGVSPADISVLLVYFGR
ncbi:MAG: hypothetical protein K2O58_01135 [Bacteroidales bacterium]|nr:hypothetical protein [Bacteroidales bacterium]